MSRCFPYPPPGYVCNRATGDALIESIKIEKEKEKTKQEKKELKRREKEQKKKERKEQKKEKEKSCTQITDGSHKRKRDCGGFENLEEKRSFSNSKHVYMQKEIELEAEQLERSSLTEEYGQPIVTESLCYSSDGTHSQSKKFKIEQSPTNAKCTTQGKVFRFRLKKREPQNANPVDSIPSTSSMAGVVEGLPTSSMTHKTEYPDPKVVDGLPVKDTDYDIARPNEKLASYALPSVSQVNGTLLPNSSPPKKVLKPKSAYESLFNEWVPLPIHIDAMEVNDDDENWLLPSKKQTIKVRANPNAYDGVSGQQSMSFQPRAHLLPEVNIYALPYTVLF